MSKRLKDLKGHWARLGTRGRKEVIARAISAALDPPAPKWSPMPEPWPPWSDEQHFAFRLREITHSAFYAGIRAALAHPELFRDIERALDGPLRAYRIDELDKVLAAKEDAFDEWAVRRGAGYAWRHFNLDEAVAVGYFGKGSHRHFVTGTRPPSTA